MLAEIHILHAIHKEVYLLCGILYLNQNHVVSSDLQPISYPTEISTTITRVTHTHTVHTHEPSSNKPGV